MLLLTHQASKVCVRVKLYKLPASAKVKNTWNCTSTIQLCSTYIHTYIHTVHRSIIRSRQYEYEIGHKEERERKEEEEDDIGYDKSIQVIQS